MKKKLSYALIALLTLFFLFTYSNCNKDEEDPVITLEGKTTMKLPLNTPYVEPGYSASDDKDGDITDKVQVSDSIVPDTVGTYVIEYSVKDEKENETIVKRTVIVYNEAEAYAGVFDGQAQFPYPGTSAIKYIDTVKASETINNELTFVNFANDTASNIIGIVNPDVPGKPVINFKTQAAGTDTIYFNSSNTSILESSSLIYIYFQKLEFGTIKDGLIKLTRK